MASLPNPARPAGAQFHKELYGPNICRPPEAAIGRIKTYWGTVVFADLRTGKLRHGSESLSPNNVIIAETGGRAYLFHITPDGARNAVRVVPERQDLGEDPSPDEFSALSQTYRILPMVAEERPAYGLQSDGLLLCAESDGRVTLSRKILGPWERFEFTSWEGSSATTPREPSAQQQGNGQSGSRPELILAIGTSHLVALRLAQRNRVISGAAALIDDFVFTSGQYNAYTKAKDGEANFLDDLSAVLVKNVHKAVVLSIWGNEHYGNGTFRNPRPFDFVLPSEPHLELNPEAEIISYDLVKRPVRDSLNLGLEVIIAIRKMTEMPIYSLSAPPPIRPIKEVLGANAEMDRASKEYGIAPSALRYKYWKMSEIFTRELSEKYGAIFIPAPAKAIDRNGFRIREYWANDWIHGNLAYGELVLQQIETVLSSIAEN